MPIAQNKQENGAYVEKCLPFTPVLHAEGQPGTRWGGPFQSRPQRRCVTVWNPGGSSFQGWLTQAEVSRVFPSWGSRPPSCLLSVPHSQITGAVSVEASGHLCRYVFKEIGLKREKSSLFGQNFFPFRRELTQRRRPGTSRDVHGPHVGSFSVFVSRGK